MKRSADYLAGRVAGVQTVLDHLDGLTRVLRHFLAEISIPTGDGQTEEASESPEDDPPASP